MNLSTYQPSRLLQPYIESYSMMDVNWATAHTLYRKWRLIPFGKPSILLIFGDPHQYRIGSGDAPAALTEKAFIVGQLKVPVWLEFSGHTKMLKIQFTPAGIRQFVKQDISEFTNKACIDLHSVFGYAADFLYQQLQEYPELACDILNSFFEKRMLPRLHQTDYINYAIEQFELSMGSMTITEIGNKLPVSGRHLERIFKKHVGLTPNEYRKLIRLNQAFGYLDKYPGTSFTNLSHTIGYYDQAHFAHDFKQFAGSKPSQLRSSTSEELFVTNGNCFNRNCLTTG
ncbi:MAG: helix-turn-helix domain-containing protein [Pseudobacter sp.]|uniref:helix-turn-helix domain-containing protein n=1 Tax=Pseudobacter sp. TaxID=2045420 RepID=UPI003F7DFEA8